MASPTNYIRFGMQRKKEFLKDMTRVYDGLVIPANILLYQYKATPVAIYMCEGKPFFVDPMSYLFGQPYENFKRKLDGGTEEFKPSFARLMTAHGLDIQMFLPLSYPRLLENINNSDDKLKNFVDNCLRFQANTAADSFEKYAKDLLADGEEFNRDRFSPEFLIPPYFLYGAANHITTTLNEKILLYAERLNSAIPVRPMVFIKCDDLGSAFLDTLTKKLASTNFPSFCLWVDRFVETDVTEAQVKALIDCAWTLSRGGKTPVTTLYGGFFQLLLNRFGIQGICHGTLFSESKGAMDAVRQGSGPAPVRYYIRELHDLYSIESSLLLTREIESLLCNCAACKRIVRGNPENIASFRQEEALAEVHFLLNRAQEKRQVGQANVEDLVRYLRTTHAVYADDVSRITKTYRMPGGERSLPVADVQSLARWANAIEAKAAEYGIA